ncbi:AI-2E family transporter [Dyella kyungheensis]|jgi:predicted PurR-regulated permease PerM|uniref:AI-2E family transporter n=1 Tax=Dyella kyungheensis TaxID=1242174 RepID=A0ABS2JWK8_9GAMM|nr:AI-2E family transporter [Dyella kyungheensis]MBM7123249.1 AI-2E family transporter [Dyella kyungheensis]
MSSPVPVPTAATASQRAVVIIALACVLALLYFGREVLVPIILALFLSLLMAPWVRIYRRIGFGHTASVLIAVVALVVIVTGVTAIMGTQVVHVARSLPQYEVTIRSKVKSLREETLGRLDVVRGELGKVIDDSGQGSAPAASGSTAPSFLAPPYLTNTAPSAKPSPQATKPPSEPVGLLTRVLTTAWVPVETAGIVLVVLIFVLLEHESLRDRFIRLAGGADLRATTAAINDAGERLSRFFISTFSVNLGVGVAIWLGLTLIGVPSALLWGLLTAALRFVPYIGVWLVAALVALFAAAVAPGWSVLLMTLLLYLAVEIIVSQLIEPFLYGHTTGLTPLAVVVAAIFWSGLWGPVGLLMSTPLTLCLVVAGRHVQALDLLNILLGDTPALTLPQRVYQRALSGDAGEIISEARDFLKRKSFAAYCDAVLLPALQLARIDLANGAISGSQQLSVKQAIVTVVESLDSQESRWTRWRRRTSVLESMTIGQSLRQHREDAMGRFQGPLAVPPGSLVLCMGLGSMADDLSTELLTRILRDLHIDARHISIPDFQAFDAQAHPELTPNAVSMVYIVSTSPIKERDTFDDTVSLVHARIAHACIVGVMFPEPLAAAEVAPPPNTDVNEFVTSLEQAAQQAIARFPDGGAKPAQHNAAI